MTVTPFELRVRQPQVREMIVWSIDAYKRYLSPHKGFACPHRLAYGGVACSDYIRAAFLEQDLMSATRQAVQRFRDCGQARPIVRQQASGGCIVIPCCIPI